jgi:quercetin dioxygenase-like cupin family protein
MLNVKMLSMVIAGVALSFLPLGLEPAHAQQGSEPSEQEPLDFLVVKPDTSRLTYDQMGNRVRFLALGLENAGQYSEFEITIPPGGGIAPNYHTKETQAFLLLDGNLTFQSEEQTLDATPGAFVYLPKNRPYSFTNTGTEPSKLLGFSLPAGYREEFVQATGTPVSNPSAPILAVNNLTATTTDSLEYGVNFFQPFAPYEENEEILVVPSGAPGRPAYDVLGERFTPLAIGEETRDRFSLIEVLSPPGAGAPLRINANVDETFFIQEGELTFQLEDESVVAPAGSLVYLPKGRAHAYVNAGTTTAKLVSLITPGGELENFFPEAGQLVTDRSTPIAPPSQDSARIGALAAKYKVQVLSPSSVKASVPEPSTELSLLGLGVCFGTQLVLKRKHKKHTDEFAGVSP